MIHGILLLYNHPLLANAPTILEHVHAFARHSRFSVWSVNTELGFPRSLDRFQFQVVVLHYSVFYRLDSKFLTYLESHPPKYSVAFFQDEHHNCPARFSLIDRLGIRCIYTLLDLKYASKVYGRCPSVETIKHTLTGYVSEELIQAARLLARPDSERTIDISYRGRGLPPWMGRGAQEKRHIGIGFLERSVGHNLALDIDPDGQSRIYGSKWYAYLASCRAVLGVEAGVSIFDLDDIVRPACERMLTENPALSFEELSARLLDQYEDNIPYRTIGPRHFEAAAFRVCQILFEGHYQGILSPMVHYIPLKKDFSNFDEVIRMFHNPLLRKELTENAYRDLIASGRYSYQQFIKEFDANLEAAGHQPVVSEEEFRQIDTCLRKGKVRRVLHAKIGAVYYRGFPGKTLLAHLARPLLQRYRQAKNPLGVT
jgi:hypothetical protein